MVKDVVANDPRKLAGFAKKSFRMSVDGGEVWFEHLDGIYGFGELVMEKLEEDSKVFSRISMPSLMAVNVDETELDDEIIELIAKKLTGGKRFTRVVFVGTDGTDKRKIKKALEKSGAAFVLRFINDFQKAKEWLVSESFD